MDLFLGVPLVFSLVFILFLGIPPPIREISSLRVAPYNKNAWLLMVGASLSIMINMMVVLCTVDCVN